MLSSPTRKTCCPSLQHTHSPSWYDSFGPVPHGPCHLGPSASRPACVGTPWCPKGNTKAPGNRLSSAGQKLLLHPLHRVVSQRWSPASCWTYAVEWTWMDSNPPSSQFYIRRFNFGSFFFLSFFWCSFLVGLFPTASVSHVWLNCSKDFLSATKFSQ